LSSSTLARSFSAGIFPNSDIKKYLKEYHQICEHKMSKYALLPVFCSLVIVLAVMDLVTALPASQEELDKRSGHEEADGRRSAVSRRGWPVRYMAGGGLMEIKRAAADAILSAESKRERLQRRLQELYEEKLRRLGQE
ncbi:hypothetical protein BOX15_Mlig025753g1, partial [Macrostomum lignano]